MLRLCSCLAHLLPNVVRTPYSSVVQNSAAIYQPQVSAGEGSVSLWTDNPDGSWRSFGAAALCRNVVGGAATPKHWGRMWVMAARAGSVVI